MAKTNHQNPKTESGAKSRTPARKAAPKSELAPEHTAQAPLAAPPRGKLGAVVELLRRPEGVTVQALSAATGWQVHSVRGAMSGALKKKLGLNIVSEKTDAGRIYRIHDGAVA